MQTREKCVRVLAAMRTRLYGDALTLKAMDDVLFPDEWDSRSDSIRTTAASVMEAVEDLDDLVRSLS